MVKQVVEASMGRAQSDQRFRAQLLTDSEAAANEMVQEMRPSLALANDGEVEELRAAVARNMAATPYLRGQELAVLIRELVSNAEQAFQSVILLSKVLFWFGLVIAVATIAFEWLALIYKLDTGPTVAGGAVGGTLSISFIYASFIKNPLDKLQNSAGNLAQLEIALFGYLDQLTLLMSVPGPRTVEESIKLAEAISGVMERGMGSVERYAEEHAPAAKA
jgi:hypothetical protein